MPRPCPAPSTCPAPLLFRRRGEEGGAGPGLPQDFWCFMSRTFEKKLQSWAAVSQSWVSFLSLPPPAPPAVFLLSSSSHNELTATSGKTLLKVDFLAFTHPHMAKCKVAQRPLLQLLLLALLLMLPSCKVPVEAGWSPVDGSICKSIISFLLLQSFPLLQSQTSGVHMHMKLPNVLLLLVSH